MYLFKILIFIGLFSSLFNGTQLEAQSIIRGPYLQMLGQKTVTLRWRTNSESTTRVWFGYNLCDLDQTIYNNTLTTEHEVVLSGLAPNTKYYYAIGFDTHQLAGNDENHYFKTSPTAAIEEPINIWVLGDAGKNVIKQRKTRDAFYEFHGNQRVDLALLLGDNAYDDGTDQQYQNTWFEDMYEDRLVNMPLFSCYGNHDAGASDSEFETGPYFEIFNHPTEGELGGVASEQEGFYSFDYGDVHIISLNNYDEDLSFDGKQYQWLKADLAANDKSWLIVICHFQLHGGLNYYSDMSWRSDTMKGTYLPLLESYGVDLVLSGHAHHYQRSYLLSEYFGKSNEFDENLHAIDMGDGHIEGDGAYRKGKDNKGTVYLISGSAGSVFSPDADLDYPAMYANYLILGTVRIEIKHSELNALFLTDEGVILDEFTIIKDLESVNPVVAESVNSGLLLYPNPANKFLNIVFDNIEANSTIELEVIDVNGRVLLNKDCQLNRTGKTRASVGELNLTSGIYFIRLNMGEEVLVKPFAVVN